MVDASNKNGSMEFTIAAVPDDFFPIRVSFTSTKLYCHIEVRWSHDLVLGSHDL